MSGIFPACHVSFPEGSPQNFPKDPATSRSLLAKNDKDRSHGGDARNFSWRIEGPSGGDVDISRHDLMNNHYRYIYIYYDVSID
jgi:hypothetical protein